MRRRHIRTWRERGTGTGPGGTPGSAPRAPGSTGTRSIWAWRHRDRSHVSQGPGTASRGPDGLPSPAPRNPSDTRPLRGRAPLSPGGSARARPRRRLGHGPAAGSGSGTAPPPVRVRARPAAGSGTATPAESPGSAGPGAHSPAAGPAPSFQPGAGLWPPGSHSTSTCEIPPVQSLPSRGGKPPVSGRIMLRRSAFVTAGSCVPQCRAGHGAR